MPQYSTSSKKPSRKRRLLLITGVALLVIAAGVGAWALLRDTTPTVGRTVSGGTLDLTPATEEDNEANNIRKSTPDPDKTLNTGSSEETVPFATTINANIITNGDDTRVIHVGSLVNGITNGKCTLTLTQGQQTRTRTSEVQLNSNSYDCGVFNIAASELPSGGAWNLTLTVSNNGKEASDNATVTI